MIRLEDFSWQYASAPAPALRGVSVTIGRGEMVVLTGPSGSGKTTLALAIAGLLVGSRPGRHGGRITVAGRDATAAVPYELADRVALVQQNPEANFATLAVESELAFALENRRRPPGEIARAVEVGLELLGIGHLRRRRLGSLSGGERQRVAIAAALAASPEVLILDEPTSGLDPETTSELLEALAGPCRSGAMTVVIIEQKVWALAPLRPRLITLADGQIVSDEPAGSGSFLAAPSQPDRMRAAACPDGMAEPLVAADDLTVVRQGRTVLTGVSLLVRPGEIVALMGPNGSGKSSLLFALLGLLRPAGGGAIVCGHDVAGTAVSEMARSAGLIFQNPDHQLLADSVRAEAVMAAENFGMADRALIRRARAALRRNGLWQNRRDIPHALSYGQKRRLNLISVMLHRPRLLLLDEPFVGQDPRNVRAVVDTVTGPADAGAAAIIATHRGAIARSFCDRVVFLDRGRVLLDCPMAEAPERLRAMGRGAYVGTPAQKATAHP